VRAIRADEFAAAIAGVPTTRYKLALFCCSAAVAGALGAIHGLFATSVYPQTVFSVEVSFVALAVALIGGMGTALGPVVGALFFTGFRELLQVWARGLHLVVLGILVIVTVLFLPGGLLGGASKVRESWYHRRTEVKRSGGSARG
jgi:branched-chain amino acid transport system permease protein